MHEEFFFMQQMILNEKRHRQGLQRGKVKMCKHRTRCTAHTLMHAITRTHIQTQTHKYSGYPREIPGNRK